MYTHQVVDGKIVLAEGVAAAPNMGLDSKKYKLVQSLEKACPNGTPSLAEATKFTVKVSSVGRGRCVCVMVVCVCGGKGGRWKERRQEKERGRTEHHPVHSPTPLQSHNLICFILNF